MRKEKYIRKTKETDIVVQLNVDGTGKSEVDTGVNFFNHMLDQLAKHSLMDLKIKAKGDIEVDYHHTVEDVGICLGETLKRCLGDKKGISRYASILLPMDDALIQVAIDFSDITGFVSQNFQGINSSICCLVYTNSYHWRARWHLRY